MTSDRTNHNTPSRSWLERLSHALMGEPKDREQLVELLRDAQQRDLLDPDALAMIEGVLQVAEMQVRDIMIPRAQMTVVERDASLDKILPVIIESAHSRFPVIGDNRDEVVGILLAKDLLAYSGPDGAKNFNVRDILRPAVFIPESKRLNMLLKEFRASRNHMAIVVDEYGGVAGLATMEDVIEEIVGEIQDEYDKESPLFKEIDANTYLVDGRMTIEEINEELDLNLPIEEGIETISGFILGILGSLPLINRPASNPDISGNMVSRMTISGFLKGALKFFQQICPAVFQFLACIFVK